LHGDLCRARFGRTVDGKTRAVRPAVVHLREHRGEIDLLVTDVVWEPYTCEKVFDRAPYGIAMICTRDADLFQTPAVLVYDIAVEAHCPDRVRRQFGYVQTFPTPSTFDRVSRSVHR